MNPQLKLIYSFGELKYLVMVVKPKVLIELSVWSVEVALLPHQMENLVLDKWVGVKFTEKINSLAMPAKLATNMSTMFVLRIAVLYACQLLFLDW